MEIADLTGKMVRRTEIIMPCRLGLHARTSAKFIFFTRQFNSEIRIKKGRLIADGKSILGVLCLGASWKSKLLIEAIGLDADQAIERIESYFQNQDHCDDDA